MNLEEYVVKAKVFDPAGLPVPKGRLCTSPDEAADACTAIGACVVKAQVPAGKRGKAGGIRPAADPAEARDVAAAILGMAIGGHVVERVLVEELVDIKAEYYAAVLVDVPSRAPLVLFSTEGGMEIEEIAAERPEAIRRRVVDLDEGFDERAAGGLLSGLELGDAAPAIARVLATLYRIWRTTDAELVEINPLARLEDGRVIALDGKFTLDESSASRQPGLAAVAVKEKLAPLEEGGARHHLKFIQLEGDVGVLANGAGLTMTTMDVISHFGGRPANFLEIGGEAYTKAEAALGLVLSNPGVKSLVVNFCGAFARTDVMAEGVVKALENLKPGIPVFFSIHGTGEDEAVALVRDRLNIEPFDLMEDAVKAAVEAAR